MRTVQTSHQLNPNGSMGRRSNRLTRVLLSIVALSAIALGCTSNPPAEPDEPVSGPIGTHQRFTGYVNGQREDVVVTVTCSDDKDNPRGRALPGQTVSAVVDSKGVGYTGDNGSVFVLPNTSAQFVMLQNWGEDVEFPTDIDVPCSGQGRIVFDPCFGFVGCRGGAVADSVDVYFVTAFR